MLIQRQPLWNPYKDEDQLESGFFAKKLKPKVSRKIYINEVMEKVQEWVSLIFFQ